MATTSRTKKTKSAQQWAWEFLRRNPDYRDAFWKVHALSVDQKAQLEMIAEGDDEQPLDEKIIRTLQIEFFDTSVMTGYKEKQKTVGEYMDQTQRLRDVLKEPKTNLWVAPKFKLKTYSLAAWYEPTGGEWPQDVVDTMWLHTLTVNLGLEPAPWAEDSKFRSDDEDDEYIGWPVRDTELTVKNKVDGRRRKSPLKSAAHLPLVQGTDGSVYLFPTKDITLSLERTQACLLFDLNLPISFQLNHAKEFLEEHQEALFRGGFVQSLPKQADRFGTFSEYLEILDMLDAGHTHLDIAKKLDGLTTTSEWRHDSKANKLVKVPKVVSQSKRGAPVNELTQAVRKKIERAIGLRDHGYRALAFAT
jgi:hypothetical protein